MDLIVCDMNMLPHMAAQCMEPLLPFLVPGGFVILTCKLMGCGRDRCAPALCAVCQRLPHIASAVIATSLKLFHLGAEH